MVRGVNKVFLLGNTAAEPDFRVVANGSNSVATVGLATNESYRDQNGNLQEQTEWHRLVFWGKLAEVVRDYCHKGSQIYVEGKIKTRSYDDQQGIKRYSTEIHVTELHLLSQKSAGNGASEPAADAYQGYPQGGYPQGGYPQAPAYQQQGYPQQPAPQAYAQQQAPAQPQGSYPQGGYQQPSAAPQAYAQQPAQPPAYQQQGYRQQRPQGSFRNAPPAGAVPVVDTPAAQPAAAPAQATPAAFQTAAPAAPQAQSADRPFKDDDLPF